MSVWSKYKAKPGCNIVIVDDEAEWVPTRTKNGNGDLMDLATYRAWCEGEFITDWDGYGVPVNAEGFEASKNCHASKHGRDLPEGTANVLWFNK